MSWDGCYGNKNLTTMVAMTTHRWRPPPPSRFRSTRHGTGSYGAVLHTFPDLEQGELLYPLYIVIYWFCEVSRETCRRWIHCNYFVWDLYGEGACLGWYIIANAQRRGEYGGHFNDNQIKALHYKICSSKSYFVLLIQCCKCMYCTYV